jgi:hypothetical protein
MPQQEQNGAGVPPEHDFTPFDQAVAEAPTSEASPAARGERGPEERPGEHAVANAPSSPQWSFTPEPAPATPPVRRPEPQFAQAEVSSPPPSRAAAEPLPDAAPPEEKKGGWWQRRFRGGA